ncbi:MAG: hypothetical protein MMC33_005312 [Icmadophila ericetorum]|nr:hypothetical protein [Icmadophila ericetorum]
MRLAQSVNSSSLLLPEGTYIYKLEPIGPNLAIISSDDSLRVLDPETLDLSTTIKESHDGVTCLASRDNILFTAGRDGHIRCWDCRTGGKSMQIKNGSPAGFLSLATSHQNPLVAAGTELANAQAIVQIWDPRAYKQPLTEYVESHSDDITQVDLEQNSETSETSINSTKLAFHPTQASCLVSGSTDGLVNCYNIDISDEDDALVQVMNHGASVAHASFLSTQQVYALSHDEILAIYNLNGPSDLGGDRPPLLFGDMRPKASCEYIVGLYPFKEGAVLGAGSHSQRRLDLISLAGKEWALNKDHMIRIADAHGGDIVRSFYIDEFETVFTAGEDGFVRVWKAPGEGTAQNRLKRAKSSEKHPPHKRSRKADFRNLA